MDDKRFALIDENGLVTNIVVADDLGTAQQFGTAIPDVQEQMEIGDTWNGTELIKINPPPPPLVKTL